jgi:hypothetical protein
MGLNVKGKLLTGQEAQEKINNDKLKQASRVDLSDQEIQFVLSKLRQSNYKGDEFETFYIIFSKLSNLIKK